MVLYCLRVSRPNWYISEFVCFLFFFIGKKSEEKCQVLPKCPEFFRLSSAILLNDLHCWRLWIFIIRITEAINVTFFMQEQFLQKSKVIFGSATTCPNVVQDDYLVFFFPKWKTHIIRFLLFINPIFWIVRITLSLRVNMTLTISWEYQGFFADTNFIISPRTWGGGRLIYIFPKLNITIPTRIRFLSARNSTF